MDTNESAHDQILCRESDCSCCFEWWELPLGHHERSGRWGCTSCGLRITCDDISNKVRAVQGQGPHKCEQRDVSQALVIPFHFIHDPSITRAPPPPLHHPPPTNGEEGRVDPPRTNSPAHPPQPPLPVALILTHLTASITIIFLVREGCG